MNPSAGIRIKITTKQEIYKHTHTHTIMSKTIFLVAASVLAFFIKRYNYRRKKVRSV